MRNKTRKLRRGLLLVLVITMLAPALSGFAVTKKQKALNAYDKWLSKKSVNLIKKGTEYFNKKSMNWEEYKGSKTSDLKFSLIYLDSDNIPELVVYDSSYCFNVLTYKNGKVKKVFADEDNWAIPEKYYKKKNIFIGVGHAGIKMNKYYYKSKGKYFLKFQDDIQGKYEYYATSKKHNSVTSERIKSLVKKHVNGTKLSKIKYHKNTKATRKKFLK